MPIAESYIPPKAYLFNNIAKTLYFLNDAAKKLIHIDGDTAEIEAVYQAPIALQVSSVELSEEASLDERYSFTHSISFVVNGRHDSSLFLDRNFVVFQAGDVFYLLNPTFGATISSTYTIGSSQQAQTEFTISIASNYPILKLANFQPTSAINQECGYSYNVIKRLFLNERVYNNVTNASVYNTNAGFKQVVFQTAELTITEENGRQTIALEATIPFSSYKADFHYHLLEFPHNTYTAIVVDSEGKRHALGITNGLGATYTIEGTDEAITSITLRFGEASSSKSDEMIVGDEAFTEKVWQLTTAYGYECVGDGVGKYILQAERDLFGNDTGRYRALAGYEDKFPTLDIIGTFSQVVTFPTTDCDDTNPTNCHMQHSMPPSMVLTSTTMPRYFTVSAETAWSISTTGSGFSVTPTTGNGGQLYTVSVRATTAVASTGTISLRYCSNAKTDTCIVSVASPATSCIVGSNLRQISAKGGSVTFALRCPVTSLAFETASQAAYATYQQQGDNVIVTLAPNASEYNRAANVVVTFNGGSATALLRVTQLAAVFDYRLDPYDYVCENGDKYEALVIWSGWTADSLVQTPFVDKGDLLESGSTLCAQEQRRWVTTEQTYCTNAHLFIVEQEQVTYDGGETWINTENTRLGQEISDPSGQCNSGTTYQYRWILSDTIACINDPSTPLPPTSVTPSTDFRIMVKAGGVDYSKTCEEGTVAASADCFTRYDIETITANRSEVQAVTLGDCDGVTKIAGRAFSALTNCTSFTFSNNITVIDNSAVYSASSLHYFASGLPTRLQTIGSYAFRYCRMLESITLPATVTSIGERAFSDCENLQYIDCLAVNPPQLGQYAFANTNGCRIRVPSASLSAYRSAWTEWASRLVAIS